VILANGLRAAHRTIPSGGVATRRRIAEGRIGGRQGLSNVEAVQEMCPFIPDLVHFECGVPCEFPLDGQRPLLNVRITWPFGNDYSKELTAVDCRRNLVQRNRRKQSIRQLWQARICRSIVRGTDDEGIDIARVVDLSSFRRIKEESVPSAHDSFVAERPPCEADPRSEGLFRSVSRIIAPAVAIKALPAGAIGPPSPETEAVPSCLSAKHKPPAGLAKSNQNILFVSSYGTLRKSQRSPRFTVSLLVTFQSS